MKFKTGKKFMINSSIKTPGSLISQSNLTYFQSSYKQVFSCTQTSHHQTVSNVYKKKPISLSNNLQKSTSAKTSHYDKQQLYEENIKLKQSISTLSYEITKLKTKVAISENQVKRVLTASTLFNKQHEKSLSKQTGNSAQRQKNYPLLRFSAIKNNNSVKCEINSLKINLSNALKQNENLKRSVKYTQIKQLQIENTELSNECERFRKLIAIYQQNNKEQSTKIKSNVQKIKHDLEQQKQKNRILVAQIKIMKQQYCKIQAREQKLEFELKKLQNQLNSKKYQLKDLLISEQMKKDEKKQNVPIFHHRNRTNQVRQQVTRTQQRLTISNKQNINCKKQESIVQIINYRFRCLDYYFKDLEQDIRSSNLKTLDQNQLRALLSCQPFLLSKQQLNYMMDYLLLTNNKVLSKIKIQEFLDKMRKIIKQFQPIEETKHQDCVNKLKKHIQLQNPINGVSFLTRDQFKNWVNNLFITQQQIQILLCQASIVSQNLDKIDIEKFKLAIKR